MNSKTLQVEIKAGSNHNEEIVFSGEGEQNPEKKTGDVIFLIKQQPHSRFTRVGDDLYYNLSISIGQYLSGFTQEISHISGKQVSFEILPGEVTGPVFLKQIKGWGMTLKESWTASYGDLYVILKLLMPTKLTEE